MVKAIKRKESTQDIKVKKKKERNIKLISLFILALLFIGFTVAGSWSFRPGSPEEEIPQENRTVEFGIATSVGAMEGTVGEVSDYKGIFGQLNVVADLNRRLNGELYLFNQGITQLIVTKASIKEIEDKASGSYLIYNIASCGEFDCLYEDLPNGTVLYEVYSLDMSSAFLTTNKVGFLASEEMAVEL